MIVETTRLRRGDRFIDEQSLSKELFMMSWLCSRGALATAVLLASTVGLSQATGETVYGSSCQSCHEANGILSAAMAKMLNVKLCRIRRFKS